jgi:ribonuclease P protein component
VAQRPRDERLPYTKRLHDPKEFQRVYETKLAVHTPLVVVFLRANGRPVSRLGVSVSTKHGNAVRRNRIKRVFRAAFRALQSTLPVGIDYVLVPRKGVKDYSTVAVSAVLDAARKDLEGKAGVAQKRLAAEAPAPLPEQLGA